jgi:hypothetical protein
MPVLTLTATGADFATGAAGYNTMPDATTARITVDIEIQDSFLTHAILDTGAPYFICSPEVARLLELDPNDAIEAKRILIRGVWVEGGIYRLGISLIADEGETLVLDAPAFVPDPAQEFREGFLPASFLGMIGCLESIRFGVDPFSQTFYFG